MRRPLLMTSGVVLATALVASGCSSGDSTSSSPSAGASAQPSNSLGAPGGSGGPGGGMQQITAVNLNTNGASPGGANTAAVVQAVNGFLATLDATKRDKVSYDFSENKARQTWSNFPAF